MIRKILGWGTPALIGGLFAAVALAGLVWQGKIWLDHRKTDDGRLHALTLARAQVIDLTTMDPETVNSKLKAMEGRLSGDFKDQFTSFADNFVTTVAKKKLSATGTVTGAAVSEYTDDSASVIVAADAAVTSGKQKPVERHWRFDVRLIHSGDQWLISGMEFVQ